MGNEVYITRAARIDDSRSAPIGLSEWLTVVAADPELQLEPGYTGAALWTGSSSGSAADGPWIVHDANKLVVKDPDAETLAKLHTIATRLNARLIGANGESYSDGMTLDSHDLRVQHLPPEAPDTSRIVSLREGCRFITILLSVNIVFSGVMAWSTLSMIRFLEAEASGQSMGHDAADALDQQQFWILITSFALYVACAVAFLQWFYRAHRNLAWAGLIGLTYRSGWAIGGFFVPLLNLVRPCRVMAEVWRGSAFLAGRTEARFLRTTPLSPLVGWWWTLFLLFNILMWVSHRIERRAQDIDQLILSEWFLFVSLMVEIIAAIVAIGLILSVTGLQEQARGRSRPAVAGPDATG